MYKINELDPSSLMQAFENLADRYGREKGIYDLWKAAMDDDVRFSKDGHISTIQND